MPNYVKNIVTITATKEQLENLLNEVKSKTHALILIR